MRKVAAIPLLALAVLAVWVALYPLDWQGWLGFTKAAYFTDGQNYAFFSGFGAWLSSTLGLSTIAATLWHSLNCHVAGCLRPGRYPVAGGQYKVCRRHHGDITGHPRRLTVHALRDLHIAHHGNPPSGQAA